MDKGDFFSTETLIAFNNGKIKWKKLYNYNHLEKPVCSPLRCNNVFA